MKKHSMMHWMALAAALLMCSSVLADLTGDLCAQRRGWDATVKLGRWHANLDKCKQYAQDNGVPLVAIWSMGDGCGHCYKLTAALLAEPFQTWMKNSGIVFYFGHQYDQYSPSWIGNSFFLWCNKGDWNADTPYVRIWWPKKGIDVLTHGDAFDNWKGRCTYRDATPRKDEPFYVPGDYDTFNIGARYCINYLTNKDTGVLRKYKYTPAPKVTYYGGDFVAPTNRYTGLQAVIGVTTSVTVPLIRTNETALAQAVCTNRYVVTYPEGKVKDYEIVWTKGQSAADITVSTSTNRVTDASADGQIVITLLDSTNGVARTSYITCVTSNKYENSAKNPFWFGERSADGANGVPMLVKGEWTMDLDVLTNRVNAYNAARRDEKSPVRAYSMVLVSGSCWCPDCAMADKWLFDQKDFKVWARENKVFLGVVDIPNNPTSAPQGRPSLLTYVSETASDAFVTCRGTCEADETQRVQSGAAYLSRHSILQTGNGGVNATAVAARNAKLAKEAFPTGWNDPERAAKGNERPGVPTVLFLREDGKIAVRWSLLSDCGPKAWNENYLKRLEEMLRQVDAENERLLAKKGEWVEEANDYVQTTRESVGKRAVKTGVSLSNFDLKDAYRIEKAAVGQVVNFKVSGKDAVNAQVKILQVAGGSSKELAVDADVWTNELSVTAQIPDVGESYLVVEAQTAEGNSATPVSEVLSAVSANTTVCPYRIESSNVLVPDSAEQVEYTEDPLITLITEIGLSYKISNLTVNESGFVTNAEGKAVFAAGATDGIYRALENDAVRVTLAEKETTGEHVGEYACTYQIWETGKIGFDRATDSVKELSETNRYQIVVSRVGGVSGTARCAIYLDREKSDTIWDGTVFEWGKNGTILEWAEKDDSPKTVTVNIVPNEFWDGDQKLVFVLKAEDKDGKPLASDAGFGTTELKLTIRDNDTETPGKLAISGSLPLYAKDMTVIAAAEDEVLFWVGRFYGADGKVAVRLDTTAGELSETELYWDSRTADEKEVKLTLSGCVPGQVVRVNLTPLGAAKADASRMCLAVKVMDSNPPAFDRALSLDLDAYCNMPIAAQTFDVDESTVSDLADVSVKLYSGRLAPGLKAVYDGAGKFVISGVPTAAGEYVAVYQVCESTSCAYREGLTATVAVKVTDPAVGTRLNPAPNPAVATARTFSDIIVRNETTKEFAGLLTLTVPKTGRLSAKYRPVKGDAIALASLNWSGFDLESKSDPAALKATLVGLTEGAENWTLEVTAGSDGSIGLVLDNGTADAFVFEMPAFGWSAEQTAVDWAGYYTVSMPQSNDVATAVNGPGYAILRMPTNDVAALAAGRMTYAGLLPNGKSFSGVSTLMPVDWNEGLKRCDRAILPVAVSSSTDSLHGLFCLKPDGLKKYKSLRRSISCREGTLFVWSHTETVADLSFDTSLDAFGGIYDAEEDIALCCTRVFEGKQPYFFLRSEGLGFAGFDLGTPVVWEDDHYTYPRADRAVRVWRGSGKNKIKMLDPEAALETNGIILTFDRLTGLVSGSVRFDCENGSVSGSFKGVVMPGWGASCAECQVGNAEAKLRPFISGPAWFADVYRYSAKGRDRALQTKRGCEFSVGLNPGE